MASLSQNELMHLPQEFHNYIVKTIHHIIHNCSLNTLRLRRNDLYLADSILKYIFFNEIFAFRSIFDWSLLPLVKLTISQQWFRNQESFIRGNLQYMQFTKGYIQYRVIWSNIHLCGLEISIKASRRYHGNHQEKSMSNDEAPCKHSISCIYKNYQSF